MRILVFGGRDFTNQRRLNRALDRLARDHVIDAIIEGNARGADRMAGYWARKRGIDNLKFPADWSQGKQAGPLRNQKMIDEGKPDAAVGFPGGRGTTDMLTRLQAAKIPVWLPCAS